MGAAACSRLTRRRAQVQALLRGEKDQGLYIVAAVDEMNLG